MFRKPRPRLTVVGERKIALDGQTVSYTIKRSPRAKHIRLEVKRGTGLTVVLPKSYDVERLPDLLGASCGWILGKLAKYREAEPLPAGENLKSGDAIPYLGRELELVVRQNSSRADSLKLEWDRLVVSLGSASRGLNVVLEQWYRIQAAKLMRKKADELTARLGLSYKRLTIRGQRTRWGSCSHKGNLSFNWKLMMAPEPVIDYVIVHEIIHLKEMNHTKRFWKLVAENCPRWREHRKWLKEHEAELATRLSPIK